MYNNNPVLVRTGEVRLSYCLLNAPQPTTTPGEKPRYSVTLLIPKTDTATVEDIRASMAAAAADAQTSRWGGCTPPDIYATLHDGDGVKVKSGRPYGDECKGHWVLNAASSQKPFVAHGSNLKTPLAPEDVYSGMHARVMISFYGYARKDGIGVTCRLGNILKTRDDTPLSGGISAEDAFGDIAAQYAAPTPPQYAQPAPQYAAPAAVPPWGGAQPPVTINPLTGLPMQP